MTRILTDQTLSEEERGNLRLMITQDIKYKEALKRLVEYLDFKGIPQVGHLAQLKLSDLYCPVKISSDIKNLELIQRSDFENLRIDELTQEDVYNISADFIGFPILFDTKSEDNTEKVELNVTYECELEIQMEKVKKIVILGDAAIGKTTLLKYLIIHLLDTTGYSIFPLFLNLRYYADELKLDKLLSLGRYLDKYIQNIFDCPEDYALDHIRAGSCMILLDGLDEIIDLKLRNTVARKIQEFVSQYETKNIVIVTSRLASYAESTLTGGFVHFLISRFEWKQISDYIDKWFIAIESNVKGERADLDSAMRWANMLKDSIKQNVFLTELVRTPLLLTILCLINRVGMPLPTTKVRIFEKCVLTLVETWEINKEIDVSVGYQDMIDVLKEMSLFYFTHDNFKLTESQLISFLKRIMIKKGILVEEKNEARSLISTIERTGIVIKEGSEYAFVHNALRDYLAAKQLAGENDIMLTYDRFFRENPHLTKNYEIIPFFISIVGESNRTTCSRICEIVLDSDTKFENYIHYNLNLVLKCLLYGAVIDGETKAKIFAQLKKFLSENEFRLRKIFEHVAQLLGTTYRGEVIKILEEVTEINPRSVFDVMENYQGNFKEFENLIYNCYSNTIHSASKDYRGLNIFIDLLLQRKDEVILNLAFKYLAFTDIEMPPMILTSIIRMAEHSDDIKRELLDLIEKVSKKARLLIFLLISRQPKLYTELLPTFQDKYPKIVKSLGVFKAMEENVYSDLSTEHSGDEYYNFKVLYAAKKGTLDIKKILEIAIASLSKNDSKSFSIVRGLEQAAEMNLVTSSDILYEIKNVHPNNEMEKELMTILRANIEVLGKYEYDLDLESIKKIIVDKSRKDTFRQASLSLYLDKIKPSETDLEFLFDLLSERNFVHNISSYLVSQKYRINEVAERIVPFIYEDHELVYLLESITQLNGR